MMSTSTRVNRLGLTCVFLFTLLLSGSPARAINRIFIENASYRANETGHVIDVKCDNDIEVFAVSLAITFDPSVIQVTSIAPAGVAADAEWDAGTDLDQIDNTSGEIIYGFLTEFDFGGGADNSIPVGEDQVIARITFDTLDVDRTNTSLSLTDGIGSISGGAINALVDDTGTTYRAGSANPLVLASATLVVDPFRPEIQVIEDNSGLEGDEFTVIGLNFTEPGLAVRVCDRTATFSLAGDGQTLTVTAPICPSCDPATDCWAPLEVINENGSDTEANGFEYLALPVPILNPPSPGTNEGDPGKTFFVTGENLDVGPLTVTLCDVELQLGSGYNLIGPTTLQVTAPPCTVAGWAPFIVTNDFGSAILTEGFRYPEGDQPPSITGANGNTGESGTLFTVQGTNFVIDGVDPTVRVGGVDVSITGVSNTSFLATAPDCDVEGWKLLEVITTAGRASLAEGFFCEEIPFTPFLRGDANNDSAVDISDAIAILTDTFLGEAAAAPCRDALDVNDDGGVDISDPIAALQYIFLGEFEIPPPFPEAGDDPTPDALPGC